MTAVTARLAVAPPMPGLRRHGAGTAGVLAAEARAGRLDPKHKRFTLADSPRPTTIERDRRLHDQASANTSPVAEAIANEERLLRERREAERVAAEQALRRKAAKLKWARKSRAVARGLRKAAASV